MRPTHILILLIVLIVLFGAKRLPDVARSIGQSMKVLKKEVSDLQQDDVPTSPPPASTPEITPGTQATPGTTAGTSDTAPAAPPRQ
ncbi:MAG TPA: Sec-independent protein translocase subunit TatA [Actinomycetaceae bacterium]|nr:Sec-independent protein translocase subunit TatA [Actinomycetaceae bacterium]